MNRYLLPHPLAPTGASSPRSARLLVGTARICSLLLTAGLGAQTPSWTNVATTGPTPRRSATAAYDQGRGETVLFGGQGATGFLSDTWAWNGTAWAQRTPTTAPTQRYQAAMAYDARRGQVVLFGGFSTVGNTNLADTWIWDGTTWTNRTPAVAPSSRSQHCMVYDSTRDRVLLFGGQRAAGVLLNDTWSWDGSTWTQVSSSGPALRSLTALADDGLRGRVVLFGGQTNQSPGRFSDTWEWDGTQWTQVAISGPGGRAGHSLEYSYPLKMTVLYGGTTGDVWGYDGLSWKLLLTEAQGPGSNYSHTMTYDYARMKLVVFGGGNAPYSGATWELGLIPGNGGYVGEKPGATKVPASTPSLGPNSLGNGVTNVLGLHVVPYPGAASGVYYLVASVQVTGSPGYRLMSGTWDENAQTFSKNLDVDALNSTGSEFGGTVSPDLLTIAYDSPNDVRMARRSSKTVPFGSPQPILNVSAGYVDPHIASVDGVLRLFYADQDLGGIWSGRLETGYVWDVKLVVEDRGPTMSLHSPSTITDAKGEAIALIYSRITGPGESAAVFSSALDASLDATTYEMVRISGSWLNNPTATGGLIRYAQSSGGYMDPFELSVVGSSSTGLPSEGGLCKIDVFSPPSKGGGLPMLATVAIGQLASSGLQVPGIAGSLLSLDPASLVLLPAGVIDSASGGFSYNLTVPPIPEGLRVHMIGIVADMTTGRVLIGNTAMAKSAGPGSGWTPPPPPPPAPTCSYKDASSVLPNFFGNCPSGYTKMDLKRGCKGWRNRQAVHAVCVACFGSNVPCGIGKTCKLVIIQGTTPGGCIWQEASCRCQ